MKPSTIFISGIGVFVVLLVGGTWFLLFRSNAPQKNNQLPGGQQAPIEQPVGGGPLGEPTSSDAAGLTQALKEIPKPVPGERRFFPELGVYINIPDDWRWMKVGKNEIVFVKDAIYRELTDPTDLYSLRDDYVSLTENPGSTSKTAKVEEEKKRIVDVATVRAILQPIPKDRQPDSSYFFLRWKLNDDYEVEITTINRQNFDIARQIYSSMSLY